MSETPPAAAAPVRPRRNWLKIALIVSLAFNALVIGIIVRSIWQFRAGIAFSGAGLETNLPAFIGTLPRERRDALRKEGVMGRPGEVMRPLRGELRRARGELTRVFLSEPFDKQAFMAAQSKVAEAEASLRRAVQELLPDIADRLTADERRAFLKWRGPGRDARGRPPGPPGPLGPPGPPEDVPDDRPGGRRRF